MGKGRAPCCDKNKVKRGPWSPAEDARLISFIQKYGHENWRALPKQAAPRPRIPLRLRSCPVPRLRGMRRWTLNVRRVKVLWMRNLVVRKAWCPCLSPNEAEEVQEKSAKRMPDNKDSKDRSSTFSGSNEPAHLKDSEEQMDSFFSFSSPYDARSALEPEEVNKPDTNSNGLGNFMIDIPFECDVEFWNMLDSLEPFSVHKADVGQDGLRPGERLPAEGEDLSWL
ncbi:hypothetical protein EUGRSUZ_F04449, partial [Eucalyptus grandis]